MVYDTKGRHVLADLWGCDSGKLDDVENLKAIMLGAAKEAKMQVLNTCWYKFQPNGCTVILLLAESHMSIHTYPTEGYGALDVYTCGNGNTAKAVAIIKEHLQPETTSTRSVERGRPYEISDMVEGALGTPVALEKPR